MPGRVAPSFASVQQAHDRVPPLSGVNGVRDLREQRSQIGRFALAIGNKLPLETRQILKSPNRQAFAMPSGTW
jgi:hypothetical protein